MKITIVVIVAAIVANFYFAQEITSPTVVTNDLDSLSQLEPESYYTLENQLITSILNRYHYKRVDVNDSLSSLIFDRFIELMDYNKSYFLSTEVKRFEKYRFELDESLKSGNISPFYVMFNKYLQKMDRRINYIDTLLMKEFDYTIDENFLIDRKETDWADSEQELNDVWRKRIKNDALNLKLNGKEWDEIQKNLHKRYENYERLLSQYKSEDVFQIAMNAFTYTIDPHTNYLSPITSDNFRIDMSLSLEGIGARLQYEDGYTKIVEIIPGGPAFKSKQLHVDDRIVAVAQDDDGEYVDVIGWRITDVVQLIRGPKDSRVRLQIILFDKGLDSDPVEIVLTRDKVKLEDQSAQSSTINITNNGISYKIGVITIPKFYSDFEARQLGEKEYKSTSRDVEKLLEELKSENVDGVIIDLRNDGGGSLEEAIKVTGLFIEQGPVVQVKDLNERVTVDRDTDSRIVYDGPLAVLVNRFSASASEIFSAAIQDYERGIIIGENTYGKGTVQNLIDLNRWTSGKGYKLGQLKLTIAKYYRIDGSSTQRMGVIPDIQFPSYVNPEEFGESSEPHALKWDKINPASFTMYSDLDAVIPTLNNLSQQRRNQNPEFDYIKEDIEIYKESAERDFISLNENQRRKEKEEQEERTFERENERRKMRGLKLLEKGEKPSENEPEQIDPYIDESARIIADLIKITTG